MDKFLVTLNRELFEEYRIQYFKENSRARIFPFDKKKVKKPTVLYSVLSLNDLLPIDSMKYNSLKEKWGDFGVWVAKKFGLNDNQINNSVMELRVFSETRAHKDNDNISGGYKLFGDGFAVKSGAFVDDNYNHINPLIICCDYDKENPRLEIRISIIDEDIKDIYTKMKKHIKNWE